MLVVVGSDFRWAARHSERYAVVMHLYAATQRCRYCDGTAAEHEVNPECGDGCLKHCLPERFTWFALGKLVLGDRT